MPSVKEVMEGFEALRFEAAKARGALSSARELSRAEASRLSSALTEDLRQAVLNALEQRAWPDPESLFTGSPLGPRAHAIAWSERMSNEQMAQRAKSYPLAEQSQKLEAARDRSAKAFDQARALSDRLELDPSLALESSKPTPGEGKSPGGALALFVQRARERRARRALEASYARDQGESVKSAQDRLSRLRGQKAEAWEEWRSAETDRRAIEACLSSHWSAQQKTLDEAGLRSVIVAKLAEALSDLPDVDFDKSAGVIAPNEDTREEWARRKALAGAAGALLERSALWVKAAGVMQERVEEPLSRWSASGEAERRGAEPVEMDLDSALTRAAAALRALRRAAAAAQAAQETLARYQSEAGGHERALAGPPLQSGPTRAELATLALALSRPAGSLAQEGFGFGGLSEASTEAARGLMDAADREEGAAGMRLGAQAWEAAKSGRRAAGELDLDASWPLRHWPELNGGEGESPRG